MMTTTNAVYVSECVTCRTIVGPVAFWLNAWTGPFCHGCHCSASRLPAVLQKEG